MTVDNRSVAAAHSEHLLDRGNYINQKDYMGNNIRRHKVSGIKVHQAVKKTKLLV